MDTLIQANIFFFITSIAVILITIMLLLLLIKLRKLVISVNDLVDKLKNATDYVGDEAKDLIEDVKQSFIWRFFFPRTKKRALRSENSPQTKTLRRKV